LKKYTYLLLVFAATAVVLQGCLNDKGLIPKSPETSCDSLNVSYNIDVKPLAEAKCGTIGCHDSSGSAPGNFTTYNALSGVSQAVKIRIQLDISDPLHMPQGGVLTQEELDIFLCWIDAGAPNN